MENRPAGGPDYNREKLRDILSRSKQNLMQFENTRFDYPPPMFIEDDEYLPPWSIFASAVFARKSSYGKQV